MVTSENRGQGSSAATADRRSQGGQAPDETRIEWQEGDEKSFVSVRDPFWFMSLVASEATIASMWGLGALVLAIVGLSGVIPAYLLPVASIVLGLAFAALGATGVTWARMFRFSRYEGARVRIGFQVGVASALIAGFAGVILGILNLAFLGDLRFGAVAVIVMGFGLLLHSGVVRRVGQLAYHVIYHEAEGRRPGGPFAINALTLAPVRDFVVGLGGVILGILAMMNFAPAALESVALLTIGGALGATASTLCGASLAALNGVCQKG